MDVVERLGRLLREAEYDGERASALDKPGGPPPPGTLAFLGRPADARLAILLSLFTVDTVVTRADAQSALAPLALDSLIEAGLLARDGAGVRGRVDLHAIRGGPITAGHPWHERADPGFVASATPASRTLARLAVGRRGGSVLEAGCGAGTVALLAARRARRVVGVDINPRALHYARLNSRLNGAENVTWMEGDWFEPVPGERFDLVLANPPFVVSPDTTFLYRDGAGEGDEISRRIIRAGGEHLSEGGFATVLCNWIHPRGGWEQPLRRWVADLGCDALLLRFASQDPLRYAMAWIGDTETSDAEAFAAAVERWVGHLKQTGVEQLGLGAVILRRRCGGANWTRGFTLDDGIPSGAAQHQLERIFAAGDFLALPAGERFKRLLSSAWRLVDGHRLDQTLVFEDGAYEGDVAVARQEPGLNLSAQVDMRALSVLAGCDGSRPLAELIERCPVPEGLDRGGFHNLCLAMVRELLARGFVVGDPLPDDLSASADSRDRSTSLAGPW